MRTLLAIFFACSLAGSAFAAQPAPEAGRCKEVPVLDEDGLPLPPPVRKVLVLPLRTEQPPEVTSPLEAAILDGAVFAESVERAPSDALGADRAALSACQRSACLAELASKAGADYVYYGTLSGTQEHPVVDLKLFSAKKGRPIGRATIEGADLIPALEQAGEELLPPPERAPFVLECGPAPLVERPLFVGGVALTSVGAIATVGAAAYALDLNQKLAVPEYHRGLKQEALDNRRLVLVGVAAGGVVLAAGAALTLTGMLFE